MLTTHAAHDNSVALLGSEVLLDTPGIVAYQYGRKLKLSKAFMADPHRSLTEAELGECVNFVLFLVKVFLCSCGDR